MCILESGCQGPDVMKLQQLLNRVLSPRPSLVPDGKFGNKTCGALLRFQQSKGLEPSGRVDPNTWNALPRGADSRQKPFMERVNAFLNDAKTAYHVEVAKKAETRSRADAQRWHIAHMIRYNSFKRQKPSYSQELEGHAVIDFVHLINPTLKWDHEIDWRDFLRDAAGKVPAKTADGKSWVVGQAPDETATRKRAYEILEEANIASSTTDRPHGAMVAPGYKGCGEPCKCGGGPSKHIAGLACDVSTQGLQLLQQKLATAKSDLDSYLERFGLRRPMKDEPWHLEGI